MLRSVVPSKCREEDEEEWARLSLGSSTEVGSGAALGGDK